ncbi:hypothetical protein FKG94_01375 [Exilibacterium tricleocarpae]|uniref:Uncharacterized protein n=1 Tax=Exilibacterium tricleocarpae TaxID=2591008 RepID=A0A545U9T6_9GAMM|nr:hypothetical protein [Exilibacterium tricleocarpae]TQV86230.1 hypothetical protein FKG94_01375 [Exilibacterium tricleocarpae]
MKNYVIVLGIFIFPGFVLADYLHEKNTSKNIQLLDDGSKSQVVFDKKGVFNIITYSDASTDLPLAMIDKMQQRTLEIRQNGYAIVDYELSNHHLLELMDDKKNPQKDRSRIFERLSFTPKSFDTFKKANIVEVKVVPAGAVGALRSTGIKRVVHYSKLGDLIVYENDYVEAGQKIEFFKEAINFYVGNDLEKPGILTNLRNSRGQTHTELRWISGNKFFTISHYGDVSLGQEKTEALKQLATWLSE